MTANNEQKLLPGASKTIRPEASTSNGDREYSSTMVALTIMASSITAMFLVSLDRTIISNAIPSITDQFHSIDDIGWYGSAYMLTNCAFQLIYGRIYKFYSTQKVFLVAIGLFEIGSAVCGAAPNSTALIIGRAVAGAGSAGVLAGVMQILVHVVPLEKRPVYTGVLSNMSGIASVVSPILAGAFTQQVSWRWCFYINLPFAAVSIVIVFLLVKTPPPQEDGLPITEQLLQLDIHGLFLFIPCVVCLILALQWGGSTYSWNDGRIIGLWVVFGLTLVAWLAVQAWKKENATVPGRIFFQRSILSSFLFSVSFVPSMVLLVYYIPIWFQAIKGDSPVEAGLSFLPFILGLMTAATLGGLVTQRIGYYVPTMIGACVVSGVGTGLLTNLFKPDTAHSTWIGLQVLCGFGVGLGIQQPILAAQTVLPPPDISTGIAIIFFGQQLGGTIFLQVAETVFSHSLKNGLENLPGLGPEKADAIAIAGATEFRTMVSSSLLSEVLKVYNRAIAHTWYISLSLSCVAIIPVLFMEWRTIKAKRSGAKRVSDANQLRGTSETADTNSQQATPTKEENISSKGTEDV
ncbi:major facilitator superfamily transporter [Penicillium macrosclerotiorum]|uniref:major facilitator superfamily transporter n=1 Tax=Penicillium macrosclerotiorum TaxID=303699 RepID=UPI0025492BFA|nr:major facilitator superfamily transporter [Penicillium macrosclerotiorum]KAJ5691963.1 major facilitator superfamily transporter [Penicillium macrosclerotiorum]